MGSRFSSARARDGFSLTGPSVALDPATHAIRPDLADIRLAGKVFAPHFAAAMPSRVTRPVALMARRADDVALVTLEQGDRFDVLEFAGTCAWGTATGPGLVGYVDREALEPEA